MLLHDDNDKNSNNDIIRSSFLKGEVFVNRVMFIAKLVVIALIIGGLPQ